MIYTLDIQIIPLEVYLVPCAMICYDGRYFSKQGEHMIRLRVKEIAKEKKISMAKLARRADIAYRTIQRIYNEPEYVPTLPTLEKIARVLGVHTNDLIEDIPDAPKKEERSTKEMG